MSDTLILYLGWLAIASLLTALAYAWDKGAARRGARRVPERNLFLLNVAGGAPGAWLAFFGLRHKTRHTSFWVVQSFATLLHLGIVWFLLISA